MAHIFDAQEIFEIAIRIEENGAAFYRKAASFQEEPSNKKFLETIARMEDRHKAGFEKMKDHLSDLEKSQADFNPSQGQSLYLKALADAHGGEGNPNISDQLTGDETMEDIVKTALNLEKESILFYIGIKDMVSPESGREKINKIIDEEKNHIAQLSGFLKKAKKNRLQYR